VVEALVRLGIRGSCSCRRERARCQEVRAGLVRVRERQAAADKARRGAFAWDDRLRSDRMAMRFAPAGLVQAQPSAEGAHLRAPGHAVVGFPAVRGL
jgi:preprotein translocase subunit Sec61beta